MIRSAGSVMRCGPSRARLVRSRLITRGSARSQPRSWLGCRCRRRRRGPYGRSVQAQREAVSRRAQVQCGSAGRVDPEGGQGVGQLDRPAQQAGMAYPDGGVGSHARPRAFRGYAVDQDRAFLDQPGGIIEAGEAALEQGEQATRGARLAAGMAGFTLGSGWQNRDRAVKEDHGGGHGGSRRARARQKGRCRWQRPGSPRGSSANAIA